MKNKDAKRLWEKSRASASRYGFKRHREDLAQEAICGMLKAPDRGATVNQYVVDAIRKQFVRPGTSGFVKRQNLNNAIAFGSQDDARNIGVSNGISLDDRYDINRIAACLHGQERAILMLNILWGFNEIEIGNIFGVSESRISQRLKRIQERLSARTEKETRCPGKRAQKMETMGKDEAIGISFKSNKELAQEESCSMESNIRSCFQKRLT